MKKCLVAALVGALLLLPGAAGAASRDASPADPKRASLCQPVPLKTPAISFGQIHVPAVSGVEVCAEWDIRANVVPTITQFQGCGSPCVAVRISKLDVFVDLKVELRYMTDKDKHSLPVDPAPQNVGQDLEDVCIGIYDSTTSPNPCNVDISAPDRLRAKGAKRSVALSWQASKEFYGRDVVEGYEIWRSETGEENSFVQVATSETTAFADTGLARQTQYWYYVVAFDAEGHRSAASPIATATTR